MIIHRLLLCLSILPVLPLLTGCASPVGPVPAAARAGMTLGAEAPGFRTQGAATLRQTLRLSALYPQRCAGITVALDGTARTAVDAAPLSGGTAFTVDVSASATVTSTDGTRYRPRVTSTLRMLVQPGQTAPCEGVIVLPLEDQSGQHGQINVELALDPATGAMSVAGYTPDFPCL
jgi:hypothetical protein